MFKNLYSSNNKEFTLHITIKCKGKKKFRVWLEDYGKVNSKYGDREIIVENQRTIYFSLPIAPKTLFVGVLNAENVSDKDYEVLLIEGPLKSYNIWIDSQTDRFMQLCMHFSQICGFEKGNQTGRIFQNENSEFIIKFFNVIVDHVTGTAMNTPARIGHKTGIIEVSKAKMDIYTIPMRVVILLHEFSHKYKNPKIGLRIDDEVGADINALYIYLGLGFSKIDAIWVFANVFLKAQTKGNIERMRKIMDYIQKFENQEFAKLN